MTINRRISLTGSVDRERVVIAGAGPAGMAAALFLAKQGIASVLVEKETFPRNKICGDGLSGWVVTMLRRLDPGILAELQSHRGQLPSHGVRFFAPNMKSLAVPYHSSKYPGEPPGHVIRRADFDAILAERVKKEPLIRLVEGIALEKAEQATDCIRLYDHTGNPKFDAEMLIAATGAGSRFAQELLPSKQDNRLHATGIRQYYSGVSGVHEGNFVDFYFLKDFLPGYLWVFPLPGGWANVGAGIRTDVLKKKKISLKRVMEEALQQHPGLRERFVNAQPESGISAWGLPLGAVTKPLCGERFILAGDAGSLIDPFTGEGVGNALWSGFAAAGHVAEALNQNRFDAAFHRQYQETVYQKLGKELKISAAMQELIRNEWLFNRVMNRASKSRFLQRSITRMIDDLDERKKLNSAWWYINVLLR